MHIYCAALAIDEMGTLKPATTSIHTSAQWIESLYASLQSLSSWFEVYFTIPPAEYSGIPFSILSQFMRCLRALYRLSTLDDPAWDKQVARNALDFSVVVQHMSMNMRQSKAYEKYADAFDAMRAKWERLAVTLANNVAEPDIQHIDADIAHPEEWWFSEIFNGWDL